MTPKIKIYGGIKPGSPVYLMEKQPLSPGEPGLRPPHRDASFTTDESLASKAYPQPLGRIIKTNTGVEIKLNAFAEGALSSLE